MTTGTFSYSTNGETFHGEEITAEAAALLAVAEEAVEPGQPVKVGENVHYDGVQFSPDGSDVISHMMDAAYGEVSEFAEDWLNDVTKEQQDELTAELRRTVGDWLKKHSLEPRFYTVVNVREMVAPAPAEA